MPPRRNDPDPWVGNDHQAVFGDGGGSGDVPAAGVVVEGEEEGFFSGGEAFEVGKGDGGLSSFPILLSQRGAE